jgi:hypothetical protein
MKTPTNMTCFLINAFVAFLLHHKVGVSDIKIDTSILADISKRYYRDMDRLKQNHIMNGVSRWKVAGYLTYWVIKLRPIDIVAPCMYRTNPKLCLYINEIFAWYIASGYIRGASGKTFRARDENFMKDFLYLLRYRLTTGDNLVAIYSLTDPIVDKP